MPFKVRIQKSFQTNVGDVKFLLLLGMWLYNSLLLLQGSDVVHAKVYQIQHPFLLRFVSSAKCTSLVYTRKLFTN